MTEPSNAPRRGAPLFLLLSLLMIAAVARGTRTAQSSWEVVGAWLVPLVFLALGTRAAFREPSRLARGFAAVLCALLVVGFSLGLVRGARERRAFEELQNGMGSLTSDLVSGEELDAATLSARMRDITDAVSARSDSTAAAVARAGQSVIDEAIPHSERFEAAFAALQDERFLDVATMVRDGDFAWQHAVLEEYESATEGSLAGLRGTVERLKQACEREHVPPDVTECVLAGARSSTGASETVFQGHLRVAASYRALIATVEEHHASYSVDEDDAFEIADDAAWEEFETRRDEVLAAEARLQKAVDAYLAVVRK